MKKGVRKEVLTPGSEALGERIQRIRDKKGITQHELATRVQTTQSAIARIERGEQNMSTEMIARVSSALNTPVITLGNDAINIQIEGRHKLKGEVTIKTSKNGAVALMAASLLNQGKTTLKNMPRIEEVFRLVEVLESIGVIVRWNDSAMEITPPDHIDITHINRASAVRTRSIALLFGPLIHYFKKFSLPHPGGCKLGSRTVKPHLFALERFGVSIVSKEEDYHISRHTLTPNEVVLYESGDTVTENAIMAAARIPGKTVIKFASANYQVQDLCFFLETLGVTIQGIGTTTLTIEGKPDINTDITYAVSEDPIEAMFFLSAAIVTRSAITIRRCPIDFLELELLKLEKMGFKYTILKRYKALNEKTNLVDIKTFPSTLSALEEKIESRPYPGLNIDNLPFFAVIATQAKGQTFIHDWVYEERAIYYKELDKLGAETILADPHRIYITGPTNLIANEVITPPALRP